MARRGGLTSELADAIVAEARAGAPPFWPWVQIVRDYARTRKRTFAIWMTSLANSRRTRHVALFRLAAALAAAAMTVAGGSAMATAQCDGDCDGDARVTIDELISSVRIALGGGGLEGCSAADMDVDGEVSVDELIAAVNNALLGCPPPPIRVERFDLAPGAVRNVLAGVEIIASAGAAIHGAVTIAAAAPGARTLDFVLTVADGDLIVDGTIGFAADGGTGAGVLPCVAPEPGRRRAPDGGGIRLRVRNGSVTFTPRSRLRTSDGRCAELFDPPDNNNPTGVSIANHGGHGGNITINVSRTITIQDRSENDGPLFELGDGGLGARKLVARTFATAADEARFIGGNGGNSGRLTITARTRNVLATTELVAGGNGGPGGVAFWDNTESGLKGSADPISSVFENLRVIAMVGGNGGMGAKWGGEGGSALYASGRAIHPVGSPLNASIFVVGGKGGGVYPSPVTIRGAHGGGGGGFYVIGNRGWDAGAGERNGGKASAVSALGGDGGDVPQDAGIFPDGRGGDGGNSAYETEFALYGPAVVDGGAGGRGRSGCDENSAGGNGGDVYTLIVRGGKGGDGPRGGDGGDIGVVVKAQPGRGADGNPPGSCGAILDQGINGEARDILEPGSGGENIIPFFEGEEGEILGTVTEPECAGAECCPGPGGGGAGNAAPMCEERGDCNFQIGQTFAAFEYRRSECVADRRTEINEETLEQTGRLVEFDNESRIGKWVIDQKHTSFSEVNQTVVVDASYSDTVEFTGVSPSLGIPNCIGGLDCSGRSQTKLYIPGAAIFEHTWGCGCLVSVRRQWQGCSPELCARCGDCSNLCYADEFPCTP
jgi:hypothetical protein